MTEEQFEHWYYRLNLLTYGELDDLEVLQAFMIILQWKADSVFISEDIPDDIFTPTEYWLFLSLLIDCIDYGTSPRGAWLTDFGIELLDFLKSGKHLAVFKEQL